ncbi:MAG: lactonase family protein [Eubacteriales bacterium]|nr:lactonase family protein [Eubacteriales bacterium]
MEFYVGTLTREGGEGVLDCSLEDDHIRLKTTVTGITDPNYVILSPRGDRLYAVSSDDAREELPGCVDVYDITGETPAFLCRQSTGGSGPCFLTLAPDGRFLYETNYGTGSLAVFPVSFGLDKRMQLVQHSGHGPHPTRQKGPHLHQVTFLPGTQLLCAIDLGTDELVVYRADEQTGLLTEQSRTHLLGGPRHIAYGNAGYAYVAHELSNEVTTLKIENGAFTPLQTLTTLPEGWTGENTAAAIRLSEDGKRLYVSNRGHGSIAEYAVQSDETLRFLRHLWAGVFPRDFICLPDGRFLVADQRAGVYLLSRDGDAQDFLPHKGAVCICLKKEA